MNIRKIVTYNNLRRQFTPDELAFADQLYSATESEKELIVESLQPQKPVAKRSSATTRKIEHCAGELDGDRCDLTRRAAVHKDALVRGYHEFVPPEQSSNKAGKKSARASSLQQQIQGTAKSLDGGVSKMRCVQEGCGEYADNPVHDSLMGYAGYHEFDSGQQVAAASGD